MKRSALIVGLSIVLAGCASMSSYEKNAYRDIVDIGARCETIADPAAAAILNVLPGFGDVYLAVGNGANSSSWGAFVLDLLFWPISVVWAVPQAVITSEEINKKECIGYYAHTEEGRIKYSRLKERHKAIMAEQMGKPEESVDVSALHPVEETIDASAHQPIEVSATQ